MTTRFEQVALGDATLHHIGFVVKDIRSTAQSFAKSLGLQWDGEIIEDPLQQARISFFRPSNGNDRTLIELVEPVGDASPVRQFLSKGGGLHHICYEVRSLEDRLRVAQMNRDIVVRQPLPAVAFNGRRIAWIYTRNKLLVEYLEAG